MRKRWAVIMVAALLLLGGISLAEGQGSPLTAQEMVAWRNLFSEQLQSVALLNNPADTYNPVMSNTYLLQFDDCLVEATAPSLSDVGATVLSAELLTGVFACPRGIRVGDSVADVLATYENNNPELTGDRGYAALYAYGVGEMEAKEAIGWGWVIRDGQTVQCIQYDVSVPMADVDGAYWQEMGIEYIIEGGRVSSIRLYGGNDAPVEEEVLANLRSVEEIAQLATFTPATALSGDNASRERFVQADLVFGGIDFVAATPEQVRVLFGEPMEQIDTDEEGSPICMLSYPDMLLEFAGTQGAFHLNAILVTMDSFAGPRGIRIGQPLAQVLDLFYHEPVENIGQEALLYGGENGAEAPYARLERNSPDQLLVYYVLRLDEAAGGGDVMLYCEFNQDTLTEYQVFRLE